MATPFDPAALFEPQFVDPTTLVYPWSVPPAPVVDPALAAPPAPPIEAAPPIPPPEAPPAFVPPAPIEATSIAAPPPPPEAGALLPGLGIPAAAADGAVAGEQRFGDAKAKLTESPFDAATGDVRPDVSDADASRYFDELRQRDPAGYVATKMKFEDLKTKQALAQREKIVNEDWQQQQDNRKIRDTALAEARKKSAEIDAAAQRIADTKIDPTVGGIGAVLMGVIGGLIQGKTGSPTNTGIEALKAVIQQRFEVQRANLASQREGLGLRRNAVADELARIGDDYHQAEVFRAAALKHADDQLATEQLKYAPRGTTFLRIADMRGQVAAEQQRAQIERDNELFNKGMKLQEAARAQQAADETRRHNRASEGLQFAQIKSAEADRKLAREQRLEDKATERADKEAERVRQFTLSSPRPMVAVDDKGKPVVGADGKPVTAAQRFTNADGKPWELGSPERTAAMEAKLVTASELSDIIDEVKDIRENIGKGVVPWSEARQRLNVLEERATLIAKQGTQGMSSDKDFDALRGSVGSRDFKSFMNISATLDEARNRTASALNTAMRAANYTGPAVTFANKYGEKAQQTVDEIRLEKLLTDPGRDETELRKVALAQERARTDNSEEAWSAYRAATASAFEATPYQRDAIAQLGVAALGPADDPEATKARQKLAKVAEEGPTSTLRRLAKSALESTALRDASSGATQPDRAVSFETAPPAGGR